MQQERCPQARSHRCPRRELLRILPYDDRYLILAIPHSRTLRGRLYLQLLSRRSPRQHINLCQHPSRLPLRDPPLGRLVRHALLYIVPLLHFPQLNLLCCLPRSLTPHQSERNRIPVGHPVLLAHCHPILQGSHARQGGPTWHGVQVR